MPFVFLLLLAWISATIHLLFFAPEGLTFHRAVEILLLHMLAFNVGLGNLLLFVAHLLRADEVARVLDWPTGTGFQKEVAFASLGLGILGILSIWLRDGFWTATVIVFSVFNLGVTWVHHTDYLSKGNRSTLDVGPILYYNIVTTLALLGLLIVHKLPGIPSPDR